MIMIMIIVTIKTKVTIMMPRFDWWDGQPDNYEHHEMCLTLWEQHDPFFPIVMQVVNVVVNVDDDDGGGGGGGGG